MKEKRILILEDELLQAIDLSEFLSNEGYETVMADTYEKGIQAIQDFKPHLVMCDINLKAMATGIDFAKEISQTYPQIKFIFITAITKAHVIAAAQQTEPLNYIVKPWKEDQIKVTVQMAFNYIEQKFKNNTAIEQLTLTEYKVLKLIAQQKSTKEIASLLYVAESTVKNHRHNMVQKLNLNNDKNSLLKWALINAEI